MDDLRNDDWSDLKRRFQRLVELPPEQQQQELSELDRSDAGMAARLRELLDYDARSGEVPGVETIVRATRLADETRPGERLGAYRVVRRLAEGGMGAVWLAERHDGSFEKQVAVKLIRGDRADDRARDRFAAERRLLAGLDHPHIARLLDGGVTDDDRLYLVMEYVDGADLVRDCDRRRLGLRERLGLFLQVIEAVQYAHQRLIIHRDLKPSNILVTREGVPKLLDFGIARIQSAARDEDDSELLGTPDYASPEQVRGGAVTTTSDVYSLGVVLYELLCGRSPYRAPRTSREALEQTICEHVPAPPSGIARDNADPEVAACRGLTPATLSRALSGDLDAIVLQCLHKEAGRRYASAQQLAEDLQRSLDGWPVSVRAATVGYRLRRFVGRNPWLAASLAAVVVVSVAAAVISYRFARETQTALGEAQTSRTAALRAQATAERELIRSEGIRSFLTRVLNKTHPRVVAATEQLTLREALELAASEIDGIFAGDPETRSAVHIEVFRMFSEFGEFEKALDHVRQARALLVEAHGPTDWQSLDAAAAEALVLIRLRRLDEAESILQAAWDLARDRETENAPIARLARNAVLNALGYVTTQQARTEEGQEWFRLAVEAVADTEGMDPEQVREAHQRIASSLGNAGMARASADRPDALRILHECLEFRRQQLPDDRVSIAEALHNIGHLQGLEGQFEEAEESYRDALMRFRETYGSGHWQALASLRGLGGVLIRQGRFLPGLPMSTTAVERAREIEQSPIQIQVWDGELTGFRRHVAAEVERLRRRSPRDLPDEEALPALIELAEGCAALGDCEEALDLLDQAREIALFQEPLDQRAWARIAMASGYALIASGDLEGALARLEEDGMEWPEDPESQARRSAMLRTLIELCENSGHEDAAVELLELAPGDSR